MSLTWAEKFGWVVLDKQLHRVWRASNGHIYIWDEPNETPDDAAFVGTNCGEWDSHRGKQEIMWDKP